MYREPTQSKWDDLLVSRPTNDGGRRQWQLCVHRRDLCVPCVLDSDFNNCDFNRSVVFDADSTDWEDTKDLGHHKRDDLDVMCQLVGKLDDPIDSFVYANQS